MTRGYFLIDLLILGAHTKFYPSRKHCNQTISSLNALARYTLLTGI